MIKSVNKGRNKNGKVYISIPVAQEVQEYLDQHCTYEMWDSPVPIPRSLLLEKIEGAEGLLTGGEVIDQELLKRAPHLRVVSNIAVGYNNFDLEAMRARGVMGTNTPGVLDETVADLTFALILAASRRISELDRYVKDGQWKKAVGLEHFGIDVHHATLGIIGMGRIGFAVARRAKLGFLMDVIYHNRNRNLNAEEALGVQYRSLESLLKEADFVVLLTPLTPETQGIMGEKEFNLMKKSAFLINVSRGATVDEGSLIRALVEGKIAGAGVDVYSQEPVPKENPLLTLSNVVTLPHIGSATAQTRHAMAMLAAQNLVTGLAGQEPANLVRELRSQP